ncbi:MAG: RsmB/NOP family class I SAM-dependent RNA methyltransferase [Trueperaceae bacterium]|nr:RsmB/NOP family class I SAM-dependent RNA methyltransferase [Trueperaceae bacterium]
MSRRRSAPGPGSPDPSGAAAPSGRGRVLQVLDAVQRHDAAASAALTQALHGVEAGPDRAMITDVAYGTLRWLPALDAALGARLADPAALPAVVLDALRAGAFERLVRGTPAHAAVHAWVEEVKRLPGPPARLAGLVNAVLRRVALADAGGPPAGVGLPGPLWEHLAAALGPHATEAARAMLQPEPLWVTAYRDDAPELLRAEGAEARPGPLPGSWALRPGRPLGALAAFRRGAIQPQNPSSAAVVSALGEVAGRRVLDVGSGHGVKAAQLAAAGAAVEAVEIDARRSEVGRRNLARLGLNARHHVLDASVPMPEIPVVDAALLDAPCTGTGTLRGHPEIKLRWTPEEARRAALRQRAMLVAVAERVRPGGTLVYAVCALGLAEGPEVVAGFLAGHPAWRAVAPSVPLPTVPAPVGAWLLPSAEGLDGFYLARLERAEGAPSAAPPA